MKISYITMQFPTPSETFASNDIKSLQNLNIDVDIYSLKKKHVDYAQLINTRNLNNLDIFHTSKKEFCLGIWEIMKNFVLFINLFIWIIKSDYNKPKYILKILASIPSSFSILKKLEKRKPDILHLFWGHYPSVVAYLVHKRLKQTKISIFLGAYDLEYSLGVSKFICKIADYVFTHTNVNIPNLEKLGVPKDKISIVYRGTVIDNLINENEKKSNIFCTGGRLLKSKNFEKVIEVFNEYQKEVPYSKLIIFGDGPNKKNLEELVLKLKIDDKVNFTGFIPQKEVLEILSITEYFLFFSIKKGERLPNVLKEAMFQQCIVLSSDTPGLDELIKNKVNGFILNNLSATSIVKMLVGLGEEQKNKIKNNAKEYIINCFNVSKCMQRYVEIWKERL